MKPLTLLALLALAACNPPTVEPKPSTPPGPAPSRSPHGATSDLLGFQAPAGWVAETPASNMRKGQFRIPDPAKKAKDAQLVVFHFGSESGTLESNIERWRGQFGGADAQTEALDKATLKTTVVDISGDYAGDMGGDPVPGARMVLAVVETDDGAWYFKVVGPAATVEGIRAAFLDAIRALKAKKGA